MVFRIDSLPISLSTECTCSTCLDRASEMLASFHEKEGDARKRRRMKKVAERETQPLVLKKTK